MREKFFDLKKAILIYSIVFIFISLIMFIFLEVGNLSLVYKGDALSQHFPSQFYIKDAILDVFYGIEGGGRKISAFNFNLGFGQDVVTTYYYYGLFDPLNLIILPLKNLDDISLYSIRIFLRLYLSGICFIVLCNHFEKSKNSSTLSVILGSVIYTFSNYGLSSGVTHPYFGYSLILLPLMIVGVDKLIRENKKILFIFISALSIIINFYFAYIIAVEVIIYAIVKIFSMKPDFMTGLKIFFRGIICYIVSVLLSFAFIVPIFMGFFDSIRSSTPDISLNLITQKHILFRYFFDFFKIPTAGDAVTAGISILSLFTLALFFIDRRNKRLKFLTFLIVLVIFCPYLQSALTGFSYANFRWTFVVELLIAYIFVIEFDRLIGIDRLKLKKLVRIVSVYMIFYISYSVFLLIKRNSLEGIAKFVLDIGAIFVVGLAIFILKNKSKNGSDTIKRRKYISMLLISSLCLSAIVYVEKAVMSGVILKKDKLIKMIDDERLKYLSKKTEGSFDRVENFDHRSMNFSDIYGYNSASVYYSIENKNLSIFNLEMNNSKSVPITNMNGLDSRAALNNILSVRYFVGNNRPPYGFYKVGDGIYENKNFIPFGFTYDSYVIKKDLDKLSSLDKQEIMMKSIVLEDDDFLGGEIKKINNPKKLIGKIDPEIDKTNLEIGKLNPDTDNTNPKIGKLNTEIGKANPEIDKTNTKIENKENVGESISFSTDKSGVFKADKNTSLDFDLKSKTDGEVYLKIRDQDSFKNMNKLNIVVDGFEFRTLLSKKNTRWYAGEKEVVINLGYLKSGSHKVKIKMDKNSRVDINELEFELRDARYMDEASKKLSKNHLEDIKINDNILSGKVGFSGRINLENDRIVFLSIPYSDAWTAKIDGEKIKIKRANIGFMAVKIPKGNHVLNMEYKEKYRNEAMIISAFTFFAILVFYVIERINRRCERK